MTISRWHRIVFLWLLCSVLLTICLFAVSRLLLEVKIEERVRQHLLLTLDESLFSTVNNQANDRKGLQHIGQQMNVDLQKLVTSHWYSAQRECVVRLQRVDDVDIEGQPLAGRIVVELPRNQIEREVLLGVSCSPNGWLAASVCILLGVLFAAIGFFLPPPLSKAHRHWINYLLGQGYDGAAAFAIVRQFDAAALSLSQAQMACLEQLHAPELHNFEQVLEVVTDVRVAALKEPEVDWFLLGLRANPDDVGAALALAEAEDLVLIDLYQGKLKIRGLEVPLGGTPLFYYAWYAMHRVNGDGWIRNPASNRPDLAVGQELAQMMAQYDGHAKAINDLEQSGLKARTLDQNRSKIKEDLVAVLGETLARAYLFETSKDPDGVHMRYRLPLDADKFCIVS